ncbi:MAG: TonB-dependent receptor [Acidobacteria bacterium]|nr:TonB-dependent receptor [Acidobacteriota bacterium]
MREDSTDCGVAAAARRCVACAGLLALTTLAPLDAAAQTATLEGQVTDVQGGAGAGAAVTAAAPGMAPVAAATDSGGMFRFATLDAGTYTLTVAMPGFRTERRTALALSAGETLRVDVQLGLAPFAQQVDVIGVGPTPGSTVSRDRVPATVAVVTAAEIEDRHAASLPEALNEQLGSVTLEGATTNLFQPTLRFRGFTASPLLGLPQGVAVYQNGARINEPFGDTVQFDLIPQFAVNRLQLSAGAEPTYGLNALGGAMVLDLKNGFDNAGFRGEFSGGSFDRYSATAEWGANSGPWAVYLGATRFDENGWRTAQPSEVTQAVADVAYRDETIDAGVTFTYADSSINGNAPAPIELLDVDRSAVFTYPDITDNRLGFVQGRFDIAVSPTWSVQVTGYYRDLDRKTLNGDEAEFEECDDDFLPPGAPVGTLCFGADDDDDDDDAGGNNGDDDADDGDDNGGLGLGTADDDDDDHNGDDDHDGDDDEEAHPLVDVNSGRFITEDDTEGNAAYNRTTTRSKGYGATLQTTAATTHGSGRENVLVLGLSADLADVGFTSTSEVGTLTPERTVDGSGLLAGLYGQAPDDIFNTGLDTANSAIGLYFTDTFSVTQQTHLTVSGRFNHARIEIADRLGTSLDGEHSFSRFNVGAGAVHQFSDAVSVFGRYAESNRAPTAAELSCADPAEPCRVPNAFISDPPLEQAVARSVEGGLRGRVVDASRWRLNWSVAVYHTAIADDILFVASPELIGTGYFQNAGDTRRVGLDAELNGQVDRLGWYASYGLVDATFQSPLELPSDEEVNDAATEGGFVAVEPGDRMPGIPRHSFKAGIRYALTDAWDVMLETVTASSRIFVGDEGNDQAVLAGYGIANLRSVYRAGEHLELFLRVDNLFDTHYATFGALAELEVFLSEVPDASDPRFVSPGIPRSAFGGVRVRF